MGSSTAKVCLQLFGPPKIIKSTGEDCTPAGDVKACVRLPAGDAGKLLPENKRSRVWIQGQALGQPRQGAGRGKPSPKPLRNPEGVSETILACFLRTAMGGWRSIRPCLKRISILPSDVDDCGEFPEGLDIGEDGFRGLGFDRNVRMSAARRATRAARFERAADAALKEPERRRVRPHGIGSCWFADPGPDSPTRPCWRTA